MMYSIAGMDEDWAAADCNTDVWYDDCILTIISQIKGQKCQFMLHDDAVLRMLQCRDDFRVCVSCCRVKKHKNYPAFYRKLWLKDLCKRGSLPLSPPPALLPVKEQQSVRELAETITGLFVLIK